MLVWVSQIFSRSASQIISTAQSNSPGRGMNSGIIGITYTYGRLMLTTTDIKWLRGTRGICAEGKKWRRRVEVEVVLKLGGV